MAKKKELDKLLKSRVFARVELSSGVSLWVDGLLHECDAEYGDYAILKGTIHTITFPASAVYDINGGIFTVRAHG